MRAIGFGSAPWACLSTMKHDCLQGILQQAPSLHVIPAAPNKIRWSLQDAMQHTHIHASTKVSTVSKVFLEASTMAILSYVASPERLCHTCCLLTLLTMKLSLSREGPHPVTSCTSNAGVEPQQLHLGSQLSPWTGYDGRHAGSMAPEPPWHAALQGL